jgi:hypothetical protein
MINQLIFNRKKIAFRGLSGAAGRRWFGLTGPGRSDFIVSPPQ